MSATARETLREMVEREMRVGGCYEGTLAIGYTDCVPVDRAVEVAVRMIEKERASVLDKPEDRLWHDADGTWWRRDENGDLKSANPPRCVPQKEPK